MAATLEHLVGLQAQVPRVPHLALWDRLAGYDPAELDGLMTSRAVVRTQLMRTTIHTVTAADALGAPAAAAAGARPDVLGRRPGVSGCAGRTSPRWWPRRPSCWPPGRWGAPQLQRELAERHPGLDAEAVAFGVSYWVPWVQPPPRGLWSGSGAAVMTTVDAWLGPAVAPASLDDLVLRYLGAFGPASVRDIQAWCGLTRLREVVDRLGPRLRRFRTTDGGELFDVPDGPLPDPDTPAPVRFLAEYDNVVLSHADRSRVVAEGDHVPLHGRAGRLDGDGAGRRAAPGDVGGPPRRRRHGPDRPALGVPVPGGDQPRSEEGARLLGFLAPGRDHDVRIVGT